MSLSPAFPVSRRLARVARRNGAFDLGARIVAEETAIAIVCNGSTQAVLMATPDALDDLAVGFALTEGLVETSQDIEDVEVVGRTDGIEARLWLRPGPAERLQARRRAMVGPTGCGLCGVESLAEAVRTVSSVSISLTVTPDAIAQGFAALQAAQSLGTETRAVHAAGFWSPTQGLVALREDVGRHNALDKLAGHLLRRTRAAVGVVLLTSRISVEMVQKTARLGAPVLAAMSAPTALAVRTADAAGMTLIAVARDDGFEIFSHPWRVSEREE